MADRVHLLINCDPQYGIHKVIRGLKGHTSKALRAEFRSSRSRLFSLWTNSYLVATAGTAELGMIKKCIEKQKSRRARPCEKRTNENL